MPLKRGQLKKINEKFSKDLKALKRRGDEICNELRGLIDESKVKKIREKIKNL